MGIESTAVLEIGTSKIRVIVGEVREDNFVTVTGMGECASTGIRKGEIINRDDAIAAVRLALKEAEADWRRNIQRLYLVTSGGQAESKTSTGILRLVDPDENLRAEVAQEDVDEVTEIARKVALPENRVKLHAIRQRFELDDMPDVTDPVGLTGEELRVDMLTIHGKRSTVDNFRKLVDDVPIDCADAIFSGLASAIAVLSEAQRQAGALVIDIGAGTTDYLLFYDGFVQLAGSLALGGEHITNDIAIGLKIPLKEAENIKIREGSAVINPMQRDHNISIPAQRGFAGKVIRSDTLNTIINARMDEILLLVKEKIDACCPRVPFNAGVVLTGGGSFLNGVRELAQKIFNTPCVQGKPFDVKGLDAGKEGPFYAPLIGCIRYMDSLCEKEEPETFGRRIVRWLWGER